jgi:hypothetical protein
MRQVLESKGWVMYHECETCGHRQHFSHPEKQGYEIRTKVKNNTFSILLNNMVIAGPFWGFEIEEKLLKYAN